MQLPTMASRAASRSRVPDPWARDQYGSMACSEPGPMAGDEQWGWGRAGFLGIYRVERHWRELLSHLQLALGLRGARALL